MELARGFADVLDRHAWQDPRKTAFRFLTDGDASGSVTELSFEGLQRRVAGIGKVVAQMTAPGERALLLFPAGLDFISAFLACEIAGVIAVPVYPPDGGQLVRTLGTLRRIAADSGASMVLTSRVLAPVVERIKEAAPELARLQWIVVDEIAPASGGTAGQRRDIPDGVAFLQYTSGSTGDPKGVVVTREGLGHNLRSQHFAWGQDESSQFVSWLPAYHDMGLIGGLLYPLTVGATATLLAPQAFVQRPLRWLEAMSKFGGTMSLAPNFAYELCVRKSTDAEVSTLDLSAWEVAGNGAEPVRSRTLERFAQRFAAAGFRRESFSPSYGLAEATLFVTSVPKGELGKVLDNGERQRASSGRMSPGTEIAIVDPGTKERSTGRRAGEIWVKSPGNARGYWNREADTRDVFEARLPDGDGPFLRTGDLGFLDDGHLYVTGRLKDLVIVAGVNHYPQDIEYTVEDCHTAIRGGCVAAFSADGADLYEDEEGVVVLAEVHDSFDGAPGDVIAAIRAAIAQQHQLGVHTVALLSPRSIPKTSSGKIRRAESRRRFLSGQLEVRSAWSANAGSSGRTAEEIESWLVAQLALRAGIDPRRIATDQPFNSYGLASADVTELSGDLDRWLGRSVPVTAIFEFPTIDMLTRHLSAPPQPAVPVVETDREPSAGSVVPADTAVNEPIAIVGIGCRFPGAAGPIAYWSLLSRGVDAIRDVPLSRWDAGAYFHEGGPMPGKMYTRRGGFLDDVEGFDPIFFGMSPAEAKHLDPQQRLLLEVAWEAIEDAGLLPAEMAGTTTGVFVGITTNDYAQMQLLSGGSAGPYAATGNVFCMAANRLSYTFDLRGPSLALDTACSSSLVAIHHACMSLRSGESEMAIAGGVNLMLSPETTVALCQSGALSVDSRCHTFDSRANGYVRGEGAGLVLLKPLRKAIADGDRVYAVIRGSAVNQDGRSNGLRAPNPEAHAQVIREAYRNAGLSPARMQYVEAHGTGTALGDPIEAQALGAVRHGLVADRVRLAVGSAKTNFGHLEPAAGVAGLAKVALALYHGALPPSLNFEEPNPHIDLDALGLEVQTEFGPWPASRETKVGGVNSFGVGGTNAHVVLEEAPKPDPTAAPAAAGDQEGKPRLLVLSARTPEALSALAGTVSAFLPASPASLEALCQTASLRRTHHDHRLAVVARSKEKLAARLDQASVFGIAGRAPKGHRRRLVFVFPGQGSQYLGMGRQLYETNSSFRAAFDECELALRPHLDWSLLEQFQADEAATRLDRDDVVQPLLFAMQVSLTATWRAWGVQPDAVIGHSMGEVAAAHVASSLTLADAARITCLRATQLGKLRGNGAMAVVALSRQVLDTELAAYSGRLHMAAANGPEMSVVSGDADAMADFLSVLQSRDIFCRPVKASGAGHSPIVDPVAAAVAAELADLRPSAATMPLYSTVTGEIAAGQDLDGGYWGRNLRQPVLFGPAIEQAADDGYDLFLEVSPNPTLVIPMQQTLNLRGADGHALGTLARKQGDQEAMLEALGTLYAHGASVDLGRIYETRLPVTSLPSGPWHRERFWFQDTASGSLLQPRTENIAPVSTAEAVSSAFSSVLRVHPVADDADFFELGGTSLMAAQMLYELRASLACEIPLRLLFDNPTIAGFTRAVESRRAVPLPTSDGSGLARTEAADYPLTFAQARLWNEPRRDSALVAQHLDLAGPLDVAALERALRRVVEVHEGLRTVIVATDEGEAATIWQRIAPMPSSLLRVTDLVAQGPDPEAGLSEHLRKAERPFVLPHGPMYRFELAALAEDRHVLSIVVHHLVTDGWSQGVLFQDLARAYTAQLADDSDDLVPPPLRLVDYARWQRNYYSGQALEDQLRFWETKLERTPSIGLPFVQHERGRQGTSPTPQITEVVIGDELYARLRATARATATTMPMIVLTAFLLALRQQSGQDVVTVPTSAAGRDRPDLDRVVGYLSTSRLISVDFSGGPTLPECLTRVRDALLAADEEQGLAWNEYLRLRALSPEAHPFRGISMNYLPEVDLPTKLGKATVSLIPRQQDHVLTRDIVLVAHQARARLKLSFCYAAGVVDDHGMAGLVADVEGILARLAHRPDGPVDSLTL